MGTRQPFSCLVHIQVSTVSDIFIAQSRSPVRVILELNSETQFDLLNHKTNLPLSKKQIIISLDPYCPAAKEDDVASCLEKLVADGFKTFIANNLAHISMLKKYREQGVNIIAGPYLYTFNRWAVSWLENQNIGAFITPLENSWDNIKATFEPAVRDRVMITAYAYPALFRMRFKLPADYDFTYFTDKEGMEFKVVSNMDGSIVMPEAPFSVTDKVDIINKNGFNRILLDFSHTSLSKQELKLVTTSMMKLQPIQDASRFNWKDGFYSPEKIEVYKAMNEKQAELKEQARAGRNFGGRGKQKRPNQPYGGKRGGGNGRNSGYGKKR